MDFRVLNTIGNKYSQKAKQILDSVVEVDYKTLTQEEFETVLVDYDAVILGLGLILDKNLLEKCEKLKVVITVTTGLDHIDLETVNKNKLKLISLKGETELLKKVTGTAELAFALILNLLRNIPASIESVKNFEWNRDDFRGHELRGKILGIVGLGRLGEMVAKYGLAFGMKVISYDPHIGNEVFVRSGAKSVTFDRLIESSDVVSIHVHLSSDTENMFNASVFDMMKPTSYLINTARGKIVNENDILTALKSGGIAGYGTDVLADELSFANNFKDHPLIDYAKTHDNCIITPHIGGMTHESREMTDIFIAKKFVRYFTQEFNIRSSFRSSFTLDNKI